MKQRPGSNIDNFNISQIGAQFVTSRQIVSKPVEVVKFWFKDRDTFDAKTASDFELILELSRHGWNYQCQKPNKKTPPYTPDSEKIWFYHHTTMKGGINKRYLGVLLGASALFDNGLKKIYHFQPKSYYDAILSAPPADLNKILPSQPKAYYELLKQSWCGKKNKKQRTTFMDEEPCAFDSYNKHVHVLCVYYK